jgi:hypothetical protein
MPVAQAMVERLNTEFNSSGIGNWSVDDFREGIDLVELARNRGIVCNSFEEEVLASIPKGQMEMLRALMRHNLQRATPLAVQFVWSPGYDFELSVWEAPGTAVSAGGISVQIKTRYPLDAHPSTIGRSSGS